MTESQQPARREGWGHPGKSRKDHYFREGRSLCGKHENRSGFDYFLMQGRPPWPEDCRACRRAVDREDAATSTTTV